jgi:alginate O-acetyltransferase complex protein AlgI
MIFNSIEFLLFAIGFFLLWPVLGKRNNSRWIFITVASFIFYGWWDWRFLFLIIGSGLIDYFCGWGIEAQPRYRKLFFYLSVFGNLISLISIQIQCLFCKCAGGYFRQIFS